MSWTNANVNREPAYLSDSSIGDDSQYNVDVSENKIITEQGIKEKFSQMVNSVETYHGFYIGRYELTGTITQPTVVKGVNPLTSDATYSVNSSLRWYGLYTMCEKLEEGNDKVHMSMIWGCQWDQAVKMSLTDKSDFLTNAGAYGVYRSSNKTVSGTKTAAYNIFDMVGNVWDWTLEASNSNFRVLRGGNYDDGASYHSASFRHSVYGYPNYDGNSGGARAQLYL